MSEQIGVGGAGVGQAHPPAVCSDVLNAGAQGHTESQRQVSLLLEVSVA